MSLAHPRVLTSMAWRACLIALFILAGGQAYAQSAVDGFSGSADGNINVIVVQADGKVLIGGQFNSVGSGVGVPRVGIARLNPDGSVDPSFNAGADSSVSAILVQSDGKILVGGSFQHLGGSGTPSRVGLGRLNPDGSVDPTFNPGLDGQVLSILVERDGKILIGGTFFTVGVGTTPTARRDIARLNADGTVDPTFNPGADGPIIVLALQADDKILVGGFYAHLGGGSSGTVLRNGLGRLNPDGSLDTAFNSAGLPGGLVQDIKVQPDGKMVVVGAIGGFLGLPACQIIRLNSDGTGDPSLVVISPGVQPKTVAIQPDGAIVAVGSFSALTNRGVTTQRSRIARLRPDGSIDPGFDPGANDQVLAVTLTAGGKILVGGVFGQIGGGGSGHFGRNHIARLNPDGSLDVDMVSTGSTGAVRALAAQRDGATLVGGDGTLADGVTTRHFLARRAVNGTIDPAFNRDPDAPVSALAVQPDGKVLVGGDFASFDAGATTRRRLARLNADGTVDPTFNPGANGQVASIAVQPDGRIVVGGSFTMLGGGGTGTTPRKFLGRLLPTGDIDPDFDPGADAPVNSILVQPDGLILVGGAFTMLGGSAGTTPRNHVGRLMPDGSVDGAFVPGPTNGASALALQADGRVLVGGGFGNATFNGLIRLETDGTLDASFNPGSNTTVNAIAVQPDGRIVIGGAFTTVGGGGAGSTARLRLARVMPNGTLDGGFDPGANGPVFAILPQPDGRLIVGGSFTFLGGGGAGNASRPGLGRLTSNDPVGEAITVSGNGTVVTWLRGGAGPEVSQVTFESSIDGVSFASLGTPSRVAGGWQLTGVNLTEPILRARGFFASGDGGGSGSIVESTLRLISTKVPTVTLNPATTFVIAGRMVNFSAAADAVPRADPQWQTSANGGATWTNIAGATGTSYNFMASVADDGLRFRAVFSNVSGTATSLVARLGVHVAAPLPTDVDADGLADLVVWRPGDGTWFSLRSSNGFNLTGATARAWGTIGDVPFMADIDGDGAADLIVWRPSNGTWYWLTSSSGFSLTAAGSKQWGDQTLGDVPMIGDIDGDRKTDLIVWRASTGTFYWLPSSTGYAYASGGSKQWGLQSLGDVPKVGDIDGDGKADLIVWRASTGVWYWLTSSTGYAYMSAGSKSWGLGSEGDQPLVGDIDGDGRTDLIVWRAPTGTWFWLTSGSEYDPNASGFKQWGRADLGDIPLLSDLDGDGRADLTVWRATSGTWYWLRSSTAFNYAFGLSKQWGSPLAGDIPINK